MTKQQNKFQKHIRKLKSDGLTKMVFCGVQDDFVAVNKHLTEVPSDDIIKESFEIDRAISEGQYTPIPDDL